jgi:hypothetical protein
LLDGVLIDGLDEVKDFISTLDKALNEGRGLSLSTVGGSHEENVGLAKVSKRRQLQNS